MRTCREKMKTQTVHIFLCCPPESWSVDTDLESLPTSRSPLKANVTLQYFKLFDATLCFFLRNYVVLQDPTPTPFHRHLQWRKVRIPLTLRPHLKTPSPPPATTSQPPLPTPPPAQSSSIPGTAFIANNNPATTRTQPACNTPDAPNSVKANSYQHGSKHPTDLRRNASTEAAGGNDRMADVTAQDCPRCHNIRIVVSLWDRAVGFLVLRIPVTCLQQPTDRLRPAPREDSGRPANPYPVSPAVPSLPPFHARGHRAARQLLVVLLWDLLDLPREPDNRHILHCMFLSRRAHLARCSCSAGAARALDAGVVLCRSDFCSGGPQCARHGARW